MISLTLLFSKLKFTKLNGEVITDLISSTFSFEKIGFTSSGPIIVNEGEDMRPDLVTQRVYGDHSKFDILLKYNGISNPFSLKAGDILLGLPYGNLDNAFKSPLKVVEKGLEKTNELEKTFIDPKTKKDKSRLDELKKKNDNVLPPNVNKPGDKNVKVKDGRVIFGEDVTSINKDNCPIPISRARLQQQLLKNKLFL
jgi:hypothetical protein